VLFKGADEHRMTVRPPRLEAKATEPVGVVDPVILGVTVAVKVTSSLTNEVESDDTTAVVVGVKPTG
jgi:hypothetical protein